MNRHVIRSRAGEQPEPAGSFATPFLLVPLPVPKDPADRKLTGTHLVRVLGVQPGSESRPGNDASPSDINRDNT
jgi:hypothetical protein